MIRRSVKRLLASEQLRAHHQQLWKKLVSKSKQGSRNGDPQVRQFISSSSLGCHSSRVEDPHPDRSEFRLPETTHVLSISPFHLLVRKESSKAAQQLGINERSWDSRGWRAAAGNSTSSQLVGSHEPLSSEWSINNKQSRSPDLSIITLRKLSTHIGWVGSRTSSLPFGCQGGEPSSSGWSSNKPGRSPDPDIRLLGFGPWSRGAIRVLSTKTGVEEEEVPARPKTIDDFQHEEIVGPTVERDMSDTANQLRAALGKLTNLMSGLKTGFVLLGSVQLLAALWGSSFHGIGLIQGLSQGLTVVVCFTLAYLLRLFGSRIDFFSKIEERARMRVLTLSLQCNKMLVVFFYRAGFAVKSVAFLSLIALFCDIF